jgi:IS4 transposase
MKILLHSLFGLLAMSASGQYSRAIELSVIGRYDMHGNYASVRHGIVSTSTQKISGTSYGANIGYRRHVTKTISASLALGYYRLAIDKIRTTTAPGTSGVRTDTRIDYSDGFTDVGYAIDKYHYNNFAATVGLNKPLP